MSTRQLQAFLNLYPGLRQLVFNFKKSLLRAHRKKLQFIFLRRCQEECVIPNSLVTKCHRLVSENNFGQLENEILKLHINSAKMETSQCFKRMNNIKVDFLRSVPQNFVHDIFN